MRLTIRWLLFALLAVTVHTQPLDPPNPRHPLVTKAQVDRWSLERKIVPSKVLEETRADGKPHGIGAGGVAAAQQSQQFQQGPRRPPTAVDWAQVAKLPDFIGVWEISLGGSAPRGVAGRGADGAPRGRARGFAGPSLTPEYAARKNAFDAHPPEDSESANCLPPGMPGIMSQPYPMEFLLTPGQVTIVIEAYTQVRHIYTDGRPLPEDPDLRFHGTSVGRWEGDTLIVDTIGFSPLTLIERGIPHGDKMRIRERFRLSDPDTMTIETTITDPTVLTTPYISNRILKRHRNWTIAEYVCEENNRNSVDANGKAGLNLTRPDASPAKKD
jgi:hypothetical protein